MKINDGIIRTNSSCIGCNRCVTKCPAPGANVSVVVNGARRMEVDDAKCVHCGFCVAVCPHHAREYLDDTESFFRDLAAGKRISLAVDPVFRILYPARLGKVLGYLRSLGAAKIYDISFGGDICAWATLACCRENSGQCLLSSDCPVVVEAVEKYFPVVQDKLLPVLSPLMCTVVYARKYLRDEADIAYIGPCIAKKTENGDCAEATRVSYSVTLGRLFAHLADVDFTQVAEAAPDLANPGLGCLNSLNGGLREILCYFAPPDFDVRCVDDLCAYSHEELGGFAKALAQDAPHPDFICALSSKLGCLGSPLLLEDKSMPSSALASLKACRRLIASRPDYGKTHEERAAMLNETFAGLDPRDFRRSFTNRYKQQLRLPPDVLEHIFNSMNKRSAESRVIDCGACGYHTCREMAGAVACGLSQMENCIHYTREEALNLYSKDNLTGISNLNCFERSVKGMLWDNPEQKYLIVYFDVKNFKMINELYGFQTGDRVLKVLARRASACAGADGACCRISGDRFALCVPYNNDTIQKLIRASRDDMRMAELDSPVSVDFGFYVIVDASIPVEQMLDYARLAQHSVKGSYEVRWAFYDEAMRGKARREAWVTKEMKAALEAGQFLVYLQPKYDSRECRMTGAEALVRWRHPEVGIIRPDEFVPVFEKNHFITRMDAYVWEEVCKLQRGWLDRGLRAVPVSVNLSRVDIFDLDLPAVFAGFMKKYRLPKDLLRLEITESAYTQSSSQLIEAVEKLRSEGFSIEMDDFGSGYSSLNTLYKMPIDAVKLDMRLIAGCRSQKGRSILTAVVEMMRLLHLPLAAEGVETAEEVKFLSDIGCYTIQGYYYSKPLPPADFEARLERGVL